MFPAWKPVLSEDLISNISFCWEGNLSTGVCINPDLKNNILYEDFSPFPDNAGRCPNYVFVDHFCTECLP